MMVSTVKTPAYTNDNDLDNPIGHRATLDADDARKAA
jgi:hypothetical protein